VVTIFLVDSGCFVVNFFVVTIFLVDSGCFVVNFSVVTIFFVDTGLVVSFEVGIMVAALTSDTIATRI
jgi:hypothetical protein